MQADAICTMLDTQILRGNSKTEIDTFETVQHDDTTLMLVNSKHSDSLDVERRMREINGVSEKMTHLLSVSAECCT